MNKTKYLFALGIAVVATAAYLALRSKPEPITQESVAIERCKSALALHLLDVNKERTVWDLTRVENQSDIQRWLCTFSAKDGQNLFVILNSNTGGFEVSIDKKP
jgi:hypothetical protein